MNPQDAVPWPPAYRSMLLGFAVCGAGIALLSLAFRSLAWLPFLGLGLVMAASAGAIWRHMGRSPMLAIRDGHLVCRRKASHSRRSANLASETLVELARIRAIERQIQPWPGAGGERHFYTVLLDDGDTIGLVPRPADLSTRSAVAAFFDRHFPGRVHETRLG